MRFQECHLPCKVIFVNAHFYSVEEEYILWKERSGRLVGGSKNEKVEEEHRAWKMRMKKG
jgi:hypothetical protein